MQISLAQSALQTRQALGYPRSCDRSGYSRAEYGVIYFGERGSTGQSFEHHRVMGITVYIEPLRYHLVPSTAI